VDVLTVAGVRVHDLLEVGEAAGGHDLDGAARDGARIKIGLCHTPFSTAVAAPGHR
jgi:hypothetical protein